jgi:hypothetical protein
LQVCVFLLALTVGADDSLEQKKVDKRGLLGLGYGYGHSLAYAPAVSYTKVSDRQFEAQDTGWWADIETEQCRVLDRLVDNSTVAPAT